MISSIVFLTKGESTLPSTANRFQNSFKSLQIVTIKSYHHRLIHYHSLLGINQQSLEHIETVVERYLYLWEIFENQILQNVRKKSPGLQINSDLDVLDATTRFLKSLKEILRSVANIMVDISFQELAHSQVGLSHLIRRDLSVKKWKKLFLFHK